jgi:hypothetical protein
MRAILSHVFEKNSERDIFSLERTPGAGSVQASAQPEFFPYAAAWKEFDKLYKAIHDGGPWRFVRTAIELLVFSGGVFGLHPSKQHKLIFLIGYPAIAALELFRWLRSRKRFLHWQCPRWATRPKRTVPACRVAFAFIKCPPDGACSGGRVDSPSAAG